MKVAVLGAAGGIGQALALLLKTQLPSGSELSLYDIAPVTPGVAVDLSHIPTAVKIKGFSGEDATPALEGADVVLISGHVFIRSSGFGIFSPVSLDFRVGFTDEAVPFLVIIGISVGIQI